MLTCLHPGIAAQSSEHLYTPAHLCRPTDIFDIFLTYLTFMSFMPFGNKPKAKFKKNVLEEDEEEEGRKK